jgi:thiamine-phosphate pyrophosphorylase
MTKKIARLHYITQDVRNVSHADLIEKACLAGIEWIQLRVKNISEEEYINIAKQASVICKQHNVKLIINDNVDIALKINADGVHLGKTDMPPAKAREILGPDAIIGGTANTFDDIKRLVSQGVDYIGLGPFRFTSTKENLSPILGLQGYQLICEMCRKNNIQIPVIAIGGIKVNDVAPLIRTGVYGIAVSSAINLSENFSEAVSDFKKTINIELQNIKL